MALVLAIAIADNSIERALAVPAFHAVDLVTRATVQVEQSPIITFTATGDPRLVRCVTANVRDGRLIIGWADRDNTIRRTDAPDNDIVVTARTRCPRYENAQRRLLIRVAAPAIDEVAIRDVGAVQVSPMRAAAFNAAIYERGSITIGGLRASATRFSIPGIGRIAATGELGRLRLGIAGNGVIDTRNAHANGIDVKIGGHGKVLATVDGPASGSLKGGGSITLEGHPNCAIRNPGGGRITCAGILWKGDGE